MDNKLKIIIAGDSGVSKSCILLEFTRDIFWIEDELSGIKQDILTKNVKKKIIMNKK